MRNLFRALAALFLVLPLLAHAEKVPATYEGQLTAGCSPVITKKYTGTTYSDICAQGLADLQGVFNNCPSPTPAGNVSLTGSNPQRCYYHGTNEANASWDVAAIMSLVCADGSAPDADGMCEKVAKCPSGQAKSLRAFSGGWATCDDNSISCVKGNYSIPSSICDNGCSVAVSGQESGSCTSVAVGNPPVPKPIFCTFNGTTDGNECSLSANPTPGTPPPPGPNCPNGQTAVQVNSTWRCLDGGTGTGTGTGTDSGGGTGTGTGGTGTGGTGTGGTGTGGTGTGTGTSPTPGLCDSNPDLDICTNKIAKEETQKKIKDILDPQEEADLARLDAAKGDNQLAADEHKSFLESFGQRGQGDGGILSWAMIPEVPASACNDFSGSVQGHAVNFDICGKLSMVRDLAGYAFYVFTVFALFRIFSGATGGNS